MDVPCMSSGRIGKAPPLRTLSCSANPTDVLMNLHLMNNSCTSDTPIDVILSEYPRFWLTLHSRPYRPFSGTYMRTALISYSFRMLG